MHTKKKCKSVIIRTLGNSPKLRMIDFLDNALFDFT